MTKHSSRKTVLWLLFTALLLAAAMIVIVDQDMLTWWPPRRWPYSFAVPFATPDLTGATELWTSVAGWEAAWSIALIFIVAALLKTPYPWARRQERSSLPRRRPWCSLFSLRTCHLTATNTYPWLMEISLIAAIIRMIRRSSQRSYPD